MSLKICLITIDVQHPVTRFIELFDTLVVQPLKVSEKKKGTFDATLADSFVCTAAESGLPVFLICGEKLANDKKLNVARHFDN